MDFFKQLAALGTLDLTLRIMTVNDKLTIGVDPGIKSKGIVPMNTTGTPEMLDEKFFSEIMPKVQEVKALVTNLDEATAQAKEKAEKKEGSDSRSKTVSGRKQEGKKPADKKKVQAKPAPAAETPTDLFNVGVSGDNQAPSDEVSETETPEETATDEESDAEEVQAD